MKNYKLYDNTIEGSTPVLNQQKRLKLRVLISLITEIVAKNSGESNYILNNKNIEVEHIWANHFEDHTDEFDNREDFTRTRNNIGNLLVLPKSFNASYNDNTFSSKVKQYFSQNILAQTLNHEKYVNNPGFIKFKNSSNLPFKAYDEFTKNSIEERADLYREILKYEFSEFLETSNN